MTWWDSHVCRHFAHMPIQYIAPYLVKSKSVWLGKMYSCGHQSSFSSSKFLCGSNSEFLVRVNNIWRTKIETFPTSEFALVVRSPDKPWFVIRKILRTVEARSLSQHCTHPRPQTSMSAPSLTHFITKRPWLKRWMTPLAHWYADAAGYRKLGLRYLL